MLEVTCVLLPLDGDTLWCVKKWLMLPDQWLDVLNSTKRMINWSARLTIMVGSRLQLLTTPASSRKRSAVAL